MQVSHIHYFVILSGARQRVAEGLAFSSLNEDFYPALPLRNLRALCGEMLFSQQEAC
jgi:hypothetical protein